MYACDYVAREEEREEALMCVCVCERGKDLERERAC